MKTLTFHEKAESEIIEAAQFYESKSDGLGASFLDAINNRRRTC